MQQQSTPTHSQFLVLVGGAISQAGRMRTVQDLAEKAAFAIREYCGKVTGVIEASFMDSDSMTQQEVEISFHFLKGLLSEQRATLEYFQGLDIVKLPLTRDAVDLYARTTEALADRVEDFEDSIGLRGSVSSLEEALGREP